MSHRVESSQLREINAGREHQDQQTGKDPEKRGRRRLKEDV